MDLPKKELRLTRDRITAVLQPHLGFERALERANNITQALLLSPANPSLVAFEMLDQLGLDDPWTLAVRIEQEWNASRDALKREGHIDDDSEPRPRPAKRRRKSGVRPVDCNNGEGDDLGQVAQEEESKTG